MTNQAALWYAKEAAKLVGMDDETIRKFGTEMYQLFDVYTEKEDHEEEDVIHVYPAW